MHRFLLLLCFVYPLAAQTATQTCSDGRVLPLTPFNRNPCGSTPATSPGGSASTPAPAPAPQPTPAPAPANDAVITCDDGRRVGRTPFNPNPCRVAAPADEFAVPDEFLVLFGGTPPALGLEVEDRLAEEAYKARFESFVAGASEPEGFAAVSPRYAEFDFGEAGFYQDRSGPRVRWPGAPFQAADASVSDALERPEAVIGTWQTQVILRGGVVAEALPAVPETVRSLNSDRLAESSGGRSGAPTVLTWGRGSQAALAVHETGPEIVGSPGDHALLTAPARPGEFVRLFLTGLDHDTGLQVSLGGVQLGAEDFALSRIADNQGGVYCLVVRVPAGAPSGDLPVIVSAAGVSSHPGPFLTVSR